MYAPTHPVHAGKYDDPDPEVNYLRPKKPSPSPTLTPTAHQTTPRRLAFFSPKCSILAAAVVQKRNAHARQRQQQNPPQKTRPKDTRPCPSTTRTRPPEFIGKAYNVPITGLD